MIGSDGQRLQSLSVVRIGQNMANKEAVDGGTNDRLDYDMVRVVRNSSLDYLVEEQMKCHKAVDSTSKPFLRYMDVRKKVWYFAIN